MNRIDQKFQDLKERRKKAFIAFITAGDPDLSSTEKLVLSFEKNGADIVELGVPFSDPLADGPTIQASSERSLRKGTNLAKILNTVKKIRRHSQVPIALMTYYNPVFHYGDDKFVSDAVKAGVDGVIIPDLPPDEAGDLIKSARKKDLATIFFIAPTTRSSRAKKIAQASTGFIYYVSLTGVTGAKQAVASEIRSHIRLIKKMTNKPVCVGFGVNTPQQAKDVSSFSDGVIVGSAIVKEISRNPKSRSLASSVGRFVGRLSRSVK